jgi:hypothetical protein
VKAALLDVSEFKHVVNAVRDYQENNEIMFLEQIESEFGVVKSCSNSQFREKLTQTELFCDEDNRTSLLLKLSFLKLQEQSTNIKELHYVVVISYRIRRGISTS